MFEFYSEFMWRAFVRRLGCTNVCHSPLNPILYSNGTVANAHHALVVVVVIVRKRFRV